MRLRGAIIGFGEAAARGHLAAWLKRPELRMNVVCDPVAARRQHALRLISSARVYEDVELMLDGERPDFVDIASPPAFHHANARTALEMGAHVLAEKPLCLKADELGELEALARRRGRVLMCVHNWKQAPAYAAAYGAIITGRIGAVRCVELARLRCAPAGAAGDGAQWRTDPNVGGGILIDHGWHVAYLMRWLMGDLDPLAVSANLGLEGTRRIDETVYLRVSFAQGRTAHAHLSWRASIRRTTASIHGELGKVEIDGNRVAVTRRDGSVEELTLGDVAEDSYHATWFAGVADEFVEAIGEGIDSPAARRNLAEARAALAIIAAARKSHDENGAAVAVR